MELNCSRGRVGSGRVSALLLAAVGQMRSVLALIWRAQMLGWHAQSGSSQILERDAARDSAAGSVRAVPVKDQHPGRST
jgi:hypothetical protein